MPHYKLTYYDARGYAEPSRLILAYAGVEYDDVRIPLGQLTPTKKAELRLTHSCLPSLEIDGEVYTQSFVIARYLATKYGLTSDDELENLRMNECVAILDSYVMKLIPLFYNNIPEKEKEALRQRLLKVETVRTMNHFDKLLKKNLAVGSAWLVGRNFSYTDIYFAYLSTQFNGRLLKRDVLKDYPELQDLRKRVFDIASLKQYIENRPTTQF